MPAYPLTFPTNIHPAKVRVSRRTAAAVTVSPTTYQQQVYQHPGTSWMIDVTIQPMSKTEAESWTQFFYDLQGRVGTFNFDLTPHCPGLSPAPGVVAFRLADPEVGWDSELCTTFSFTFRAVQAQ